MFNGIDGEFRCTILSIEKSKISILIGDRTRQSAEFAVKINLVFSVPKTQYIQSIITKCTEIGVNSFCPIATERSSNIFNEERVAKIAIEACEQSERLDIPVIHTLQGLQGFLQTYVSTSANSCLVFCDEHAEGDSTNIMNLQIDSSVREVYVLIGSEGGFSPSERDFILHHESIKRVTLGSTILKCDTAAIVACYAVSKFQRVV